MCSVVPSFSLLSSYYFSSETHPPPSPSTSSRVACLTLRAMASKSLQQCSTFTKFLGLESSITNTNNQVDPEGAVEFMYSVSLYVDTYTLNLKQKQPFSKGLLTLCAVFLILNCFPSLWMYIRDWICFVFTTVLPLSRTILHSQGCTKRFIQISTPWNQIMFHLSIFQSDIVMVCSLFVLFVSCIISVSHVIP